MMKKSTRDSMHDWLVLYPPGKADSTDREPPPVRGASQSPYLDNLVNTPPRQSVDLHGLTGKEAESLIRQELRLAYKKGYRKIQIIHGRGLHSEEGPVLPDLVRKVLADSEYVLQFGNEPRNRGGDGATWVILKAR